MRITVVGGTGTIGRRLVPELRSRGHDVVVGWRQRPRDFTTLREQPTWCRPRRTGYVAR